MKKFFLFFVVTTSMILQAYAGGLVSNTNQSASYYRMLARGATTEGDAVYYNPAGLAFMEQGFTLSLNTQMIWMQRTINNDLGTLNLHQGKAGNNSEFVGNLYVPFFPGIYAAYKTGQWTFSLGFNPPAGGGSIEFADGLPMLELPVSVLPGTVSALQIPTANYSMSSMMKGSSICYGVQAGASYRITDVIGAFAGVRMLFASNSYEGYLREIKINPQLPGDLGAIVSGQMVDAAGLTAQGNQIDGIATTLEPLLPGGDPHILSQYYQLKTLAGGLKAIAAGIPGNTVLDVSQKGNGIAPILGVHINLVRFHFAAKYEFKTNITIKNETASNAMNMYPDGLELRSDVPALLSLAGSMDIVPSLKLSVGYIHHFEKQAKIESWVAIPTVDNPAAGAIMNRADLIDGGTNEILAGLEFNLNERLTFSTGCQYSMVNVSDLWQNDITHNLTNFTFGLGAAFNINERITLNIGGLNTWYTTSTVEITNYTQKYDRTNKAIALGIDFRF